MPERDTAVRKQKLELLQKYNTEANRITQESIETSLLLLMEEKDFSSISITEITSRAGVSRTAYYRNYASKEDILTNIFNRTAETIVNALSIELASLNMVNSYLVLFKKVLEIKELFVIIQKAGMVVKFQMAVNEKYLQAIDVNSPEAYYRVLSWIGSVFNIIFGWLQRGSPETPEQMAHICSQFLSEEEWRIGSGIKWSTGVNEISVL